GGGQDGQRGAVDVDRAAPVHRSCFLFSSRRRHTRSKRDWSSDVCSSDLQSTVTATRWLWVCCSSEVRDCGSCQSRSAAVYGWTRSEERRVGKEWRSRG